MARSVTARWMGGLAVGVLAVLALPGLGSAAKSHVGFFPNGYVDARSCLVCHQEAAGEIMSSSHYTMRSESDMVEYPGGGAHGMMDRACGLRGTNTLVNYDYWCGKCHVGDTVPLPDPATGEYTYDQKINIDCLICHASVYDMNRDGVREEGEDAGTRVRVWDRNRHREVWYSDRSAEAAESVGGPITTEMCLRCHEHGQGSYEFKRGTPYDPETDVHAAMHFQCTTCHMVDDHKIARGNRVTDMMANDLPEMDVICERCHGEAPHADVAPMYDRHLDVIACETCHITETAGVRRQTWAPTFGVTSGPEVNVPLYDAATGTWKPYIDADTELVSPTYRWFNGGASMLAEPIDEVGAWNMQYATRETPGAKIYAFRNIVNGMVMDRRGIPGMPDFDPQYTMLGALRAMEPLLKGYGMMRPEGLTPQEEAMMGQFPNLLTFDQAEYFSSGDISAAVSIGLARAAATLMGMDHSHMTRSELIAMGSPMWSGEYVGLDLPDNPFAPDFQPDNDPTTATGSFIKLSHAIKGGEEALHCADCHTAEGGRLDFALLGYDEETQQFLETLLDGAPDHRRLIGDAYGGPIQCESCHPGKINEVLHTVHYKFESPLPENYQYDREDNLVDYTHSGKLWKVCGFPTTIPQINWLGNLCDLPETPHIDNPGGCGTCHIGMGASPYSMKLLDAPTLPESENIDCLMCHAADYSRKVFPATANGSPTGELFFAPRVDGRFQWSALTEAAWSVGPTSAETCNRCHAKAGGGTLPSFDGNYTSFKRGSVYAPGEDLHADAGLSCSDCHSAGGHKTKRPRNNDLSAYDTIIDHQLCMDCHGGEPHENTTLNTHLTKVSCTTCHARSIGGASYKDFSQAIPPDPNVPCDLWKVPVTLDNTGADIAFKWFNGSVGYELEPRGTREDSLIYPYKPVTFNQPVDANGQPVPVKWGVFFKTGNMVNAANIGRNQYAAAYQPIWTSKYGLPTPSGPFAGYHEETCGGFSISHGITLDEALSCGDCHNPDDSVLDWDALGYSKDRADQLRTLESSVTDWHLAN